MKASNSFSLNWHTLFHVRQQHWTTFGLFTGPVQSTNLKQDAIHCKSHYCIQTQHWPCRYSTMTVDSARVLPLQLFSISQLPVLDPFIIVFWGSYTCFSFSFCCTRTTHLLPVLTTCFLGSGYSEILMFKISWPWECQLILFVRSKKDQYSAPGRFAANILILVLIYILLVY